MLNLVTIVSAEELKKVAEPIAEIRRLENELQAEQYQKRQDEKFAELVQRIADNLQATANKGYKYYSELIRNTDIKWQGMIDRLGELKEIFEQAGYKVKITFYSSSWTYKSGKVADLDISFS